MVHISGHADTLTLPAAPSLTRRTRPVSYWTPSTARDRNKYNYSLASECLCALAKNAPICL